MVIAKAGDIEVQTLAEGLNHPWGMAFLPDNRLLVTERAGTLRIEEVERIPLDARIRDVKQAPGGSIYVQPTRIMEKY